MSLLSKFIFEIFKLQYYESVVLYINEYLYKKVQNFSSTPSLTKEITSKSRSSSKHKLEVLNMQYEQLLNMRFFSFRQEVDDDQQRAMEESDFDPAAQSLDHIPIKPTKDSSHFLDEVKSL